MKYVPMVIDPDYQYFDYKNGTLYELIEKRISSKKRNVEIIFSTPSHDTDWIAYMTMMRDIGSRLSDGLVITDKKVLEAITGSKDDWERFKDDFKKRYQHLDEDLEFFAKW